MSSLWDFPYSFLVQGKPMLKILWIRSLRLLIVIHRETCLRCDKLGGDDILHETTIRNYTGRFKIKHFQLTKSVLCKSRLITSWHLVITSLAIEIFMSSFAHNVGLAQNFLRVILCLNEKSHVSLNEDIKLIDLSASSFR